jgi:hypothetical protein
MLIKLVIPFEKPRNGAFSRETPLIDGRLGGDNQRLNGKQKGATSLPLTWLENSDTRVEATVIFFGDIALFGRIETKLVHGKSDNFMALRKFEIVFCCDVRCSMAQFLRYDLRRHAAPI